MVFDRDHWRALATDLHITYDCRIGDEGLRAMVEDKLTSILAAGRNDNGACLFSGGGYKGYVYRDIGRGNSTQDDSACKFGTLVYDWTGRHVATIGDVRSAVEGAAASRSSAA